MSALNAESTAFRSALEAVRAVEPRIADAIAKELTDQRESLKRARDLLVRGTSARPQQ